MKTVDETDEGNWLIYCKCQSNDFEKASNCVRLVVRLTLALFPDMSRHSGWA